MSSVSPGVKQNQSLGKALRILEKMAEYKHPVRLQTLSSDLKQSPSTVLRFINAFIDQGYVAQDADTSRYYLTLKLASLGETVKASFPIREIVRPFLIEITASLGESSSMAVEQGMRVVYVDSIEGPDYTLRTLQRIGKAAPLNSTGAGKILLLNYYPDNMDTFFSKARLERLTHKSIVSERVLLSELENVNRRGYAVDDEEGESGVRCVAVPIRDFTGMICTAVSVTGPVARMTNSRIQEISHLLIETAGQIEAILAKV